MRASVSAAAFGSDDAMIAETTQRPSAPAARTAAPFEVSMPPMATIGRRVRARTAANPAIPMGGAASGLVDWA